MSGKPAFPGDYVDFGAPTEPGAHLFRVEIPPSRTGDVAIVEDFGSESKMEFGPPEEVRAVLKRPVWSGIAETARLEFNKRLKAARLSTSRWRVGDNKVERLLGRELCVLAWAAELAEPAQIPIVCSKWLALRPEERWWLFIMTATEAGLADDKQRGWRKALYYALSDGQAPAARRRRLRIEAMDSTPSLFQESHL